ncbi:MAG: hypothetical protein K0U93_21605 [Gammaproteobacteria bacterium]|nr:hypothetical protein [Gammaproteobacteria bacterium]
MDTTNIKVHFIHGLEGSPSGNKARLFAKHFSAVTPAMNTADFAGCVAQHADALAAAPPDVLIGSSFGGAVAVALLQSGSWTGRTLLLAQAAQRRGLPANVPARTPIWIAHGRDDTVVPIEDSRQLAKAGDPDWVRLIEVDDDHALHGSTTNGALLSWIEDLAAWAPAHD